MSRLTDETAHCNNSVVKERAWTDTDVKPDIFLKDVRTNHIPKPVYRYPGHNSKQIPYLHIPKSLMQSDTFELKTKNTYLTEKQNTKARYSLKLTDTSIVDAKRKIPVGESKYNENSTLLQQNSRGKLNICDYNKLSGLPKNSYHYKPVPVGTKSKRRFVDETEKDDNYWQRRKRNNEAAKRSREQRRNKEIEISAKYSDLRLENERLRLIVVRVQEQNVKLENRVSLYEEILKKNDII